MMDGAMCIAEMLYTTQYYSTETVLLIGLFPFLQTNITVQMRRWRLGGTATKQWLFNLSSVYVGGGVR